MGRHNKLGTGGTGKQRKTKIKDAKKISEAATLGYFSGKAKAEDKKNLLVSAKEHLGKIIDRVDPLEIGAVVALTPIIRITILGTEDLINRINSWAASFALQGLKTYTSTVLGFFDAFIPNLPGIPLKDIVSAAGKGISGLPTSGTTETTVPKLKIDDWLLWALSFFLAFMVVRYGGDIIKAIGSATGSLTSLIGLLLPAAGVAAA